jgi:hypothetical protein
MELRIINVDLSVIVGVVGSFLKIFATSGRFEAMALRRVGTFVVVAELSDL